MSLSTDDLKYMKGEFDGLHKRVTDGNTKLAKEVSIVKEELAALRAAACKDVKVHEQRYHTNGTRKRWQLIAAVVASVTGILLILGLAVQAIAKGVTP